jgi:hypothetical protein
MELFATSFDVFSFSNKKLQAQLLAGGLVGQDQAREVFVVPLFFIFASIFESRYLSLGVFLSIL